MHQTAVYQLPSHSLLSRWPLLLIINDRNPMFFNVLLFPRIYESSLAWSNSLITKTEDFKIPLKKILENYSQEGSFEWRAWVRGYFPWSSVERQDCLISGSKSRGRGEREWRPVPSPQKPRRRVGIGIADWKVFARDILPTRRFWLFVSLLLPFPNFAQLCTNS